MNWTAYVFLTFTVGALAGAYYALSSRPKNTRTDAEWVELCVQRQREAWDMGLSTGRAQGELVGQTRALDALSEQLRGDYGEVTIEDVERARRGLIH